MKNYIIKRNDLFGDAFDGLFRPFFPTVAKDLMRTDIRENEGEYVFDVEIPGFSKEEITVSYEDGYLGIGAKRADSEGDVEFLRKERNVSCERNFYVGEVDEKGIKAKYENGVLTVCVPKKQPERVAPHNIAIE